MKIIFLTGSSGMLGSDLKKKLKKKYKVVTLSNNYNNRKSKYLDYSSKLSINNFIKKNGIPNYFLHLGWGKMQEPHSSYHIKENYINSKNLVDVFFNRGLKNFIFVGTINEYGSQNGAVTEKYKSKKKLRNYEKGKTKFANYGKKLSKKISKNFIHIRLSNLYGPLQKKNSLIHSIHKAYNEGKELNLSPLNIYRDYLFSEEAATGIEKIIKKVNETLTINLGSGKNIYMRHFVKQYWKLIGGENNNLNFGSLSRSRSDSLISKFYLSLKLLKKNTGWYPRNNLKKNIKKNIKSFKLLNV